MGKTNPMLTLESRSISRGYAQTVARGPYVSLVRDRYILDAEAIRKVGVLLCKSRPWQKKKVRV